MVKQIIWSRLAHEDKKSIIGYWINRDKSAAYSKRLNDVFENTAELVAKHPKIGKKTDIPDVRIKTVLYYAFTYKITGVKIEILTIWDSRQDPQKLKRITKDKHI